MNQPPQVLVADDSQSVRVYLRQRLEEQGLRVTVAADGLAAIDSLQTSSPDLAILDVNMPRANGFQVCEALQASGESVPVIFLTSEASNAVRMLGAKMGAYLQKPVAGQRLVQTVHSVLAQHA